MYRQLVVLVAVAPEVAVGLDTQVAAAVDDVGIEGDSLVGMSETGSENRIAVVVVEPADKRDPADQDVAGKVDRPDKAAGQSLVEGRPAVGVGTVGMDEDLVLHARLDNHQRTKVWVPSVGL